MVAACADVVAPPVGEGRLQATATKAIVGPRGPADIPLQWPAELVEVPAGVGLSTSKLANVRAHRARRGGDRVEGRRQRATGERHEPVAEDEPHG